MAGRRAPAHLGTAARRLWKDITAVYELRPDELLILEQACRQVDDIQYLEGQRSAEDFEVMVRGSQGQDVINPVIPTLNTYRQGLRQLLNQLNLPDEESQGERSSRAREAANARWKRGA